MWNFCFVFDAGGVKCPKPRRAMHLKLGASSIYVMMPLKKSSSKQHEALSSAVSGLSDLQLGEASP